ncbi:ATP-binding cassette-type vacuolar membrane transporter Hmt1 [Microbotryomycetes sp. JL221]|nr:ATP-binding cassette-type vacuolar membrane transporter Hmt1 [Microbotryomycetes sp. JL221]
MSLRALYDALAILRLCLPIILIVVLSLRFLSMAFTAVVTRVQAQGWDPSQDEYAPVPSVASATSKSSVQDTSNTAVPDDITPVVVKIKTGVRSTVVVALYWLAGVTYVIDGLFQVIFSLVHNVWTPSLPLWENVETYVLGGLASFSACVIAMSLEERSARKKGAWGRVYPRLVAAIAFVFETGITVLLARVLLKSTIELAVVIVRAVALLMLLLFQLPILYKSDYVPASSLERSTSERSPLLAAAAASNGRATRYGSNEDESKPAPSPLRASRPPNNRPPDPKSLSLLTLFTRVKTLFPYLWPSRSFSLQVLAVICIGLMFLKRFVNVLVPILFGRIISDLSAGRSPYQNIVFYSIASFLRSSNNMLYRYLWLPIEQYSEREMNSLSFDCLLELSLSYHTKRKTGELLRILSRSDAINNFFETLIFTFIPVIIDLPVAAVVIGIRYGFLIVSIVAGVGIIFVTASVMLAESRVKLYRELRDENQFMHQIKTDALFNYETVKIFTAERFESQRLRNAMRTYQAGYFRVFSAWNSLSLIQESISAFGFLVCSFVLAQRVIEGEMDVGSYVTFVNYLTQIYQPLNSIAGLYRNVMSGLVDTEQLMELLNEDKDVVDQADAVDLEVDKEQGVEIEFDNVSFSYDGKRQIIKGVSFKIERGQSVSLVGPSGGGKSTIMRLLYRFYDVTEGSIKINGHDIRRLTQTSLRKAIGLVPQESILFNETARFNLAYAAGPGVTQEQIEQAAKVASMHDRIMSFPEQYETRVGERGQRLSGGEKQRVAIARVVLKNPPVLLLDEASSSLDTANERVIQARLRELSKGRTTLTIAHRLSTIVDSDVIYVLDEGKVVERGNHNQLLGLGDKGVYATLWQKQIEGQESTIADIVNASTPIGERPNTILAAGASKVDSGPSTPAKQD